MKKIILFSFFALAFKILSAQVMVGLQAGLSNNRLRTNIDNRPSTSIDCAYGYAFGLPFHTRINSYLDFLSIPNITQKNYVIDRTGSLQGAYIKYHNDYLQLPLLIEFVYGKRLQSFLHSGGYIGYWSGGRLTGKTPGIFSVTDAGSSTSGQQTESFQLIPFDQKYQFNSQSDRRVELGWVAGAGCRYRLSNRYFLEVDCSYYQSFTDQQKKYMIGEIAQYNETFTVSAGVLYAFKK